MYLIILLILGIFLAFLFLTLILKEIFRTERGKQETMKIFAQLSDLDIKRVYDLCDLYLDNFEGNQISDGEEEEDKEVEYGGSMGSASVWGGGGGGTFLGKSNKKKEIVVEDEDHESHESHERIDKGNF